MNVYEILEKCLVEIEQGADVDTVLFRYPEYADELRPVLQAAVEAKVMAAPEPSAEVARRNRAKVLQRAAEMREAKVNPSSSRVWFASLRRLAVTLAVVTVLFVSGTGLVGASANTLPGDNLYPVKRTWEGVQLLFAFDPQQRAQLEIEQENERLSELDELFAEGRSEPVEFAGYVTRQTGTGWNVSGVAVTVSAQTVLPASLSVGDAVRVTGITQADGTVLASRIVLLPPSANLPEGNDNDSEISQENANESTLTADDNSNSGAENEAPEIEETKTPKAESELRKETFDGTLESIDSKNNIWTVDGKKLDISTAEIIGIPLIGASVKVEGYTGADGVFVVTRIEIFDNANGNDDSSGNVNVNDNSNDNDNINANDNSNGNDNNDNNNNDDNANGNGNGNDDNSGSGGGD